MFVFVRPFFREINSCPDFIYASNFDVFCLGTAGVSPLSPSQGYCFKVILKVLKYTCYQFQTFELSETDNVIGFPFCLQ